MFHFKIVHTGDSQAAVTSSWWKPPGAPHRELHRRREGEAVRLDLGSVGARAATRAPICPAQASVPGHHLLGKIPYPPWRWGAGWARGIHAAMVWSERSSNAVNHLSCLKQGVVQLLSAALQLRLVALAPGSFLAGELMGVEGRGGLEWG